MEIINHTLTQSSEPFLILRNIIGQVWLLKFCKKLQWISFATRPFWTHVSRTIFLSRLNSIIHPSIIIQTSIALSPLTAVNRRWILFTRIPLQKHKNVTGGIFSSHCRFKRLIQRRYSIFKQKILYDSRQYANEAAWPFVSAFRRFTWLLDVNG